MRRCSVCGKPMSSGFCLDGGYKYYCSEECLLTEMTWDEWLEAYGDGDTDSYWTEWEEEDDEEEDEEIKRWVKLNITREECNAIVNLAEYRVNLFEDQGDDVDTEFNPAEKRGLLKLIYALKDW